MNYEDDKDNRNATSTSEIELFDDENDCENECHFEVISFSNS